MITRLKIKPETTWLGLDLYETIPISANITQDDITDIGGSSFRYTKTFVIPGTKNNNKLFKNFYSVSGIDFDPLTKIECVVEDGGNIVFEGFLRLNAVIINDEFIDYEVFIVTALSDFSSEIQGVSLRDLDYQDLNHDLEYSAITTSWGYTGGTSGLFNGQLIYPLINYGLSYDGSNNPSFEMCVTGSSCFTSSSYSVPESYFKPAIQLKSLVDRIFDYTSYNYQSDFFNSDYFKSIYMSLSNNGELGITLDDADASRNQFKVYAYQNLYYQYDANDKRKPVPFSTLNPDGYDPLNSFTLDDDMPGQSTDDYRNYFNVPVAGDYYFNLRFSYTNQVGINVPTYFRIRVFKDTSPTKIDNGTLLYETGGSGFAALGTRQDANIFFSGSLLSNEYVSVYLEFIDTAGFPENGIVLYGFEGNNTPMWDLYTSPSFVGTQEFGIKQQLPEIGIDEFMKSLFGMFNLVVEKNDVDKLLTIEPWDYYFNDSSRATKDWTKKLDLSSSIRIEPLDFTLSKDIEWTYNREENEDLNDRYYDENNVVYGTKKYTSPSNILTGKQTIKIPFNATPTDVIPGSEYIIIPQTYSIDDNDLKQPEMDVPHIFFWVGNRFMYTGETGVGETSWYIQSGNTEVEWRTYPCVNHLSKLDNVSGNEISDLNFSPYWDYYKTSNGFVNPYSSYSLYSSFWSQYINSIYSPEARRLKGRFYLTPDDIGKLKLNDKIFVKDNYWRVEKITDANLVDSQLVEVSLIKELNGFHWLNPPSPEYTISPNAAFPPSPINTLSWYTENNLETENIIMYTAEGKQLSNNNILFSTTNDQISGSTLYSNGDIRIVVGFTYRDFASPKTNLELTFGVSSGDDTYGRLAIPTPIDNTYYQLDVTQYFSGSTSLYMTIDTY